MGYYLRKDDHLTVQTIIRLLKSGIDRLEGDPDRIVHLIRNASNLEGFPDYKILKEWQFRKKEGWVKVTKKVPLPINLVDKTVEEQVDLLSIISLLSNEKPSSILFLNTELGVKDIVKLENYCKDKYSITINNKEVKLIQIDGRPI